MASNGIRNLTLTEPYANPFVVFRDWSPYWMPTRAQGPLWLCLALICGTTNCVLVPSLLQATLWHSSIMVCRWRIFSVIAVRLVCAGAGDLILWDSRTVHANGPATVAEHAPDQLLRMVCYTCMTPRAWASDNCIRDRQKAYERGVGSTHWPHDFRPRGDLQLDSGEGPHLLSEAPEVVRRLVGECPPIARPPDEAMAAMEMANQLEASGDLAGAKEWIDKAVELGHNCLAEYGGWK